MSVLSVCLHICTTAGKAHSCRGRDSVWGVRLPYNARRRTHITHNIHGPAKRHINITHHYSREHYTIRQQHIWLADGKRATTPNGFRRARVYLLCGMCAKSIGVVVVL